MRKFKFNVILSVCLAFMVSVSAFYAYPEREQTVYAATTAQSYYSSITATEDTALLGQLHDLITSTHTRYTSYNDCKDESTIMKTDAGSNSKSVMEFYSQADISKTWNGNADGTWNREHVWCQSLSNGLWGTSGAGSDLHHIRPAERNLNSKRGNNKFGIATNGTPAYYKNTSGGNEALGGYLNTSTDTFEPLDNVKGDVARIVFYVYTHYNTYQNVGGTTNGSKSSTFGTLKFTNIVSKSSESAAIEMLLEWNELDPVDSIETARNDAVYEIQGNRNPFIDNEQYANAIWGDGQVNPDATTVRLNKTTLSMKVGASETLTATTNGEGTLSWETSNSSVVTVSNGVLRAVGEGTATVTAKFGEASATCKVTVSNSLSLDKTQVTLKVGEQATVVADAVGSVEWKSSDEAIATVSNGVITAVSAGLATITATCGSASVNVKVTVTDGTGETPAGTETVVISMASFHSLSGSYGFYEWGAGSLGGTAYLYGGNKDLIQVNKSKSSYYLASTVAAPGGIVSVTVIGSGTARDWQLLTSNEPYGNVSGVPTNGNDWGTKTVTDGGATWKTDGKDKYFTLNYAFSGTKGAGYIESITVVYNTGEVTPTPDDPVTSSKFSEAVKAISTQSTLEGKFKAIKAAVNEYNSLTEEEKTEYASDYALLLTEIDSYNATADKLNANMSQAVGVSATGAIVLTTALVALAFVIKQRIL